MPHFVEIQVPGVPSREHELTGELTALGSGVEAGIRVHESSGLAARHLELLPREEGVVIAVAPGVRGSLVFRGQESLEVLVPWGEEAYANAVRLAFVARTKRARSPLIPLLAPALLVALGMALLPGLRDQSELGDEVAAPPLALPEVACREQDARDSEHRAREAERAAAAKLQRSPFVAREGVEALDLFQESTACFTAAGQSADAARVRTALDQWSGRLNEDYAAATLRLRLALDQGRHREALSTVRHLQALLSARSPSAYSQWLSSLGRRLEHKVARSGS